MKTTLNVAMIFLFVLTGLVFAASQPSVMTHPQSSNTPSLTTDQDYNQASIDRPIRKLPRRDEFYSDSVFYEYGFEDGWGGWTSEAFNDVPRYWHSSEEFAYAGSSWWCSDEDFDNPGYDNHWLQYLQTPPLDLEDLDELELSFVLIWNCEDPEDDPPANEFEDYDAWDGCNVWISPDGGLSWEVLIPEHPEYNYEDLFSFGYEWGMGLGIPGWCGFNDQWMLATFDLDEYATDNVIIRWAFCSDPFWSTAEDTSALGYQVDNIRVRTGGEIIFENNGEDDEEMILITGQAEMWEITDRDAHDGDYSAFCRNMVIVDNALISPWLTIPDEPWHRARFEFWVRLDLRTWDGNNDGSPDDYFKVEVTNNDERWIEVFDYWTTDNEWFDEFNYYGPGTNDNQNMAEWQRMLDLTEFAGDSVKIRWTMKADAVITDNEGSGLYIDDFRLIGLKRQTLIEIPQDSETIQGALDQVEDSDTILVHPGVYTENLTLTGKNITLISLFHTTGDVAYIDSTILDGGGTGTVMSFEEDIDSTTIFSGFTLTNGLGDFGGGLYCNDASPSISYCRIEGNTSGGEGGGIYCRSGSDPVIDHCLIVNNVSTRGGGAISCRSSGPHFVNCIIFGNIAEDEGGGAAYCRVGYPTFTNSILWGNTPQEIFFYNRHDANSVTFNYSDLEGGPDAVVTNDNGEVIWNQGSIDSDPLFDDEENEDFSLDAHYLLVDGGDPRSPLDSDTSRADMGAIPFDNGPRRIEISPLEILFEHVEPGDSAELGGKIGNPLDGYLRLFSSWVDHEYETDVFTVNSFERTVIQHDSLFYGGVKFFPPEFGDYYGTLMIYCNDPQQDTIRIPIEAHSLSVGDMAGSPLSFSLESIYPNPFNSTATIEYSVPSQRDINLVLLDVAGREIRMLHAGVVNEGRHRVNLDANDIPAGVYLVKLSGGSEVRMQKVVLLK